MTLPFLTADVPGCGGQFKVTPEDFVVEEIPAYLPCGEGEHLFLWVEKRGTSTPEVARQLARHLGLTDRDVSWAGLKDSQAVTRQTLCVPARVEAKLSGFSANGLTILHTARHRNKLKTGHLTGNRFEVRVRGVTDPGAARATLERLRAGGLPNFFGEQRFGRNLDNAAKGKAILCGGGRSHQVGRFERKLFLSAYQAELFNRVLAQRVLDGSLAQARSGDVLKKHLTGGEFVCQSPEVDGPRVEAFEVSPTGPMFGPAMREPGGGVKEAEWAVLQAEGLTLGHFAAGKRETEGARRFLRVPLGACEAEFEGDVLSLRFSLPAGSYATALLREVLKSSRAGEESQRPTVAP